MGDGAGESPEARKAWGGEAPGDRSPAEADRPRAGDGRRRGKALRHVREEAEDQVSRDSCMATQVSQSL